MAADAAPVVAGADTHPERWRALLVLAVAELFGMSLWFAASAVALQYGARWNLDDSSRAWITSVVPLGFVIGTAAVALLNLADIIPAKRLFAVGAIAGAVANAALVTVASYRSALVLRFVTGVALAAVYPPAMKMISTWFRARRGLAVGGIVGALTVGKATPYLVHAIPSIGYAPVILTASALATMAAILVTLLYRDGPFPFPPRPFSWGLVGDVFRSQEWRLATCGYLGHMAELYAAWTWLPSFLLASAVASRHGATAVANETSTVSALSFAALAIGGIGCVWGGIVADRRGREWLVTRAMLVSGLCALGIGLSFGHSMWIVAAIALVWGFFVIADSAQFSVLVTESVAPHAVGTALTVQTSIGFLLTIFTIQMVPPFVRVVGWQWAFTILAIGPALGIAAIGRLTRVRAERALLSA